MILLGLAVTATAQSVAEKAREDKAVREIEALYAASTPRVLRGDAVFIDKMRAVIEKGNEGALYVADKYSTFAYVVGLKDCIEEPASEGVQEFYNALAQAHEGVTANGAGIVLCTKSEEGNELFADAPFPVILYNDSLKAAVGKNSGMIEDEEIPNTASWYVNGSFYSSWSLKVDAEDLVEDAAAFVEMSQDKELSGADSADSGAAGMVPMG